MRQMARDGRWSWGRLCSALLVTALLIGTGCTRSAPESAAETNAPARQPAAPGQAAAQPPAAPPAPGAPTEPKGPLMRPLFDNERLRVLEVAWPPHAAAPAVKQGGGDTLGVVGVVTKGGTIEYTSAKGQKTRQERTPGEVIWQPVDARIEARENVSGGVLRMVQMRLKKAPPTKQYSGPVASTRPLLDNARVAVFDYKLPPGQGLPMHKYGPRVWVVLEGGELKATDTKGHSLMGTFVPAQVGWFDAEETAINNIGKSQVRVISVELK